MDTLACMLAEIFVENGGHNKKNKQPEYTIRKKSFTPQFTPMASEDADFSSDKWRGGREKAELVIRLLVELVFYWICLSF